MGRTSLRIFHPGKPLSRAKDQIILELAARLEIVAHIVRTTIKTRMVTVAPVEFVAW